MYRKTNAITTNAKISTGRIAQSTCGSTCGMCGNCGSHDKKCRSCRGRFQLAGALKLQPPPELISPVKKPRTARRSQKPQRKGLNRFVRVRVTAGLMASTALSFGTLRTLSQHSRLAGKVLQIGIRSNERERRS